MKNFKDQKGFTGLEVILIVVVACMIVGGGVYVYTKQHAATNTPTSSTTPVTAQSSVTPETEDDQIRKAAGCDSSCKILHKQAGLADVTIGDEGGAHVFLAKEHDKWSVIFRGNGDVPSETVQKYSIPSEWMGPQL